MPTSLVFNTTPFFAIMALCFVSLTACEDDRPEAYMAEPARILEGETIVARVNGEAIYAFDVELEAISQSLITLHETLDPKSEIFQRTLDQLIDQKLLAQEAKRLLIDKEPRANHRLNAARELILGNLLIESEIAEKVDEAAIEKMYREQLDLLELGQEVHIRQILVATREEAQTLHDRLQAGTDFSVLAIRHSIDSATKNGGGDMGYVNPAAFSEPLVSLLLDTPVGRYSRPVKTDAGWRIIQVINKRAEKPPSLEDLRPDIIRFLTMKEVSETLEDLRVSAEISYEGSAKAAKP